MEHRAPVPQIAREIAHAVSIGAAAHVRTGARLVRLLVSRRQIRIEDVVDDFPIAVVLFLPDRHSNSFHLMANHCSYQA